MKRKLEQIIKHVAVIISDEFATIDSQEAELAPLEVSRQDLDVMEQETSEDLFEEIESLYESIMLEFDDTYFLRFDFYS